MPWAYQPPQRPPCPHRPPKSKNKNVNNHQKYSKTQESGLREPAIPNPIKGTSEEESIHLEISSKHFLISFFFLWGPF